MLKAPFPWAGGKSRVAHLVWQRFGDCLNYVEPFAGSLAVLLARPFPVRIETINDADWYVSNFWRTLAAIDRDPGVADEVAYYADYPVIECDLHARHLWLVNQIEFRERMAVDPDYYDAKIAGWWVWGLSAWIGSGWCDVSNNPKPNTRLPQHKGRRGVHRDEFLPDQKRPNLPQRGGRGIHRLSNQRPNLRPNQGVEGAPAKISCFSGNGQGVNRTHQKRPQLGGNYVNAETGTTGRGIHRTNDLYTYMQALADRLRRVRVCCGDWTRIMGKSVTYLIGDTAVFLDPPYSDKANRSSNLYAVDSESIAHDVREWCLENGDNPKLRIALCGYDGEHNELEKHGWSVVSWEANGGYGNQRKDSKNENKHRERIWFSPHCLNPLDDIMTGKRAGVGDLETLPLFATNGRPKEPTL